VIEFRQNPTQEEAKFLRESQWIIAMAKGPGWTLLKAEMERMVAQVRDLAEGSESSDPKVNEGLRLRVKMLKAAVRDIVGWVETQEAKQKQLVEQLNSEPDPESFLQRIGDEFEEMNEHESNYA